MIAVGNAGWGADAGKTGNRKKNCFGINRYPDDYGKIESEIRKLEKLYSLSSRHSYTLPAFILRNRLGDFLIEIVNELRGCLPEGFLEFISDKLAAEHFCGLGCCLNAHKWIKN